MNHPPTGWPERTLALVRSLMQLVWGLSEPDARPAPQALVERRRGPAA